VIEEGRGSRGGLVDRYVKIGAVCENPARRSLDGWVKREREVVGGWDGTSKVLVATWFGRTVGFDIPDGQTLTRFECRSRLSSISLLKHCL